jgi:pantoate--beta-alanine ligase
MATPELVVLRTRAAMRDWSRRQRGRGARLGFVPTMGALHAGHLSLVALARADCDAVVASIFVNPLQFGPGEDLERYPRDFDGDRTQLARAGCDALFAPDAAEMYAPDAATFVEVADLQDRLCGATRPGHFRGVATVVAKLFHVVAPHQAWFGQKDFQQLLVVKRMARDLDLPIEVIGVPTVREANGLALSSRNAYLSKAEHHQAASLFRILHQAAVKIRAGQKPSRATAAARRALTTRRFRVDYVAARNAETLALPRTVDEPMRLLAAVWLGGTRLIDNIAV